MNNSANLESILDRRAVRRFSKKELPDSLIRQVLLAANRAPSGFNLQPWYFIVVRDRNLKKILRHVAMDQPQVEEAPVVVAFVADPNAWKKSYKQVLSLSEATGAMSEKHRKFYEKSVNLLFQTGPFGLFGLAKKIGVPLRRLRRPTPNVICSFNDKRQYVKSQTMLAASTFMIAAKMLGLDTSPMEGFDEYRLKKLLKVPKRMSVPLIVAIGYELGAEDAKQSVRLPLTEKMRLDFFDNKDEVIQEES